jgi:NADH:ubiquinone oxidoreductase subunit 3 (subunit A)
MASGYIAIIIFMALSLFMPFSMILTSMMIRRRSVRGSVEHSNYESAEDSTGARISIMNEYFHYFSMFLAYEIIVAIVLIWAASSGVMAREAGAVVLSLAVFGFVMELFVSKLAVVDSYG